MSYKGQYSDKSEEREARERFWREFNKREREKRLNSSANARYYTPQPQPSGSNEPPGSRDGGDNFELLAMLAFLSLPLTAMLAVQGGIVAIGAMVLYGAWILGAVVVPSSFFAGFGAFVASWYFGLKLSFLPFLAAMPSMMNVEVIAVAFQWIVVVALISLARK